MPSVAHEQRRRTLATIAALSGCHIDLSRATPDRFSPDVFSCDPDREVVFVGEAKHAETPGCHATLHRLGRYVDCASALSRARTVILGVCFGERRHDLPWLHSLRNLAEQQGLCVLQRGIREISEVERLAWVVATRRPVDPRKARSCGSTAGDR